MCGIVGFWNKSASVSLNEVLRNTTAQMADALRHRGPDSEGVWIDLDAGIALGHRRLAILELSPAGAQPMQSDCGRFVIAFNGEIYNHLALRAKLSEVGRLGSWRSASDTETLLAAISHWGLSEALQRAKGMFALALWDRSVRTLSLARDRMGEKPLYLLKQGRGWAFASELNALLMVPGFRAKIDPAAVSAYLAYGYVPDDSCIYEGVTKVPPGHIVVIAPDAHHSMVKPYQTFADLAFSHGYSKGRSGAALFDELASKTEAVLREVIGEQMLSDVPLGCFLSGGVDSSLVAALMQKNSERQISTFSIGFGDARFNEAPHAAAVARQLGTEHHEFIVSEQDALALTPDLADTYGEPFADSSQIPTILLCQQASRSVKVALTGDGGDEVFGGYNRHVYGTRLLKSISRVPGPLKAPLGQALQFLGRLGLSETSSLRQLANTLHLPVTAIDKLPKMGKLLTDSGGLQNFYTALVTTFDAPETIMAANARQIKPHLPLLSEAVKLAPTEWMMAMDSLTYLPGDILVKIDRAAMSASLETRAPFLDARVVSAAWQLPPDARVRNQEGKAILRTILAKHVPRDLTDRPKQGFAIPLDRWLRGELRHWCEALIHREDLLKAVWLDHAQILSLWNAHQERHANHGQKLWTIVMLLSWVECHLAQQAAAALKHHEIGVSEL